MRRARSPYPYASPYPVVPQSMWLDAVRIADMPDLGAVTDASSFVGELAGSGRFAAPALKAYLGSNYLLTTGGIVSGDLNVTGTIASGHLTVQNDLTVSGPTTLNTLHVQGATNLDGATTVEELLVQPGANGIFAATDNGYLAIGGSSYTVGGANLYLSGKGRPPYAIEFWWSSVRIGWWETAGGFFIIGNASKPGGGSWVDSSDARIKTVTGDYTQGLAEVLQLQPKTFRYRGNETLGVPSSSHHTSPHAEAAKDGTEYVGMIAQDVEPVFPEMVANKAGTIDGVPVTDLKVMDTTALIYALVNSCKELAARIEALEAA